MTVTILRKTGFFGTWGALSLIIDGEEITTIKDGQTVSFELPTSPTYLNIKGDPKSAILVSDHQKYILCMHPLFQLGQLTFLALIVLKFFLQNDIIQWIIFFSFILLAILMFYFWPRYSFKPLIGPKIKINEFC